MSPCESPFFMSKELAFKKPLWYGGAVDGHERTVFSRAHGVYEPREELFACAALA
jgi:hypothetical protein